MFSSIPSRTLSCLREISIVTFDSTFSFVYSFMLFHVISSCVSCFFLCWFLSVSPASLLFSSLFFLSGFPFSSLLFHLLSLLLLRFLPLPFPFPIFLFLRYLYPLLVFIFTRFSSLFSQLLPTASSSFLSDSLALLPPPPSFSAPSLVVFLFLFSFYTPFFSWLSS